MGGQQARAQAEVRLDHLALLRDLLAVVPADVGHQVRGLANGEAERGGLHLLELLQPGDPLLRERLGQLGERLEPRADEALPLLVDAAREPELREQAREAAVEVFVALGEADPRVRTWRPRLAAALF